MTTNSKKNDVIAALLKLADGLDGKSDAAKLREVIDPVELALSSGVSRKKVLETISESLGISMTMKTFEKNLYRIRKKRKQQNINANIKYPDSVAAKDKFNQPDQCTESWNKNTQLVTVHSSRQPTVDLDNDEEENWEPKTGELEFRKNVKKGLDIQELNAMGEKFRNEEKEKKKRNREQAKLKNQSTY